MMITRFTNSIFFANRKLIYKEDNMRDLRDLRELKKEQENDILFWGVKNAELECLLIYREFGLDSQSALTCLEFLDTAFRERNWIEIIDWATTLAQNVRFDLLENGIDIEAMNTLMSNLLEVIEVATKKQCKELRK